LQVHRPLAALQLREHQAPPRARGRLTRPGFSSRLGALPASWRHMMLEARASASFAVVVRSRVRSVASLLARGSELGPGLGAGVLAQAAGPGAERAPARSTA